MKTIEPIKTSDWWETPLHLLARCGGYYECPKDTNGNRLGPLVGYAGRTPDGRQFVGDVYVNFAMAERHAPVLRFYVRDLFSLLGDLTEVTGFCGAPEGGKALALQLAMQTSKQYIYPEKKVITAATPNSREVSELVFDRHTPEAGDSWWIVEDVCNNFSTTAKLVALIDKFGASVRGIACFLNRSLEVDEVFRLEDKDVTFPVVALVRQPIAQYQQDDPAVAADIATGNVVWKPKNDWSKLAEAMARQKGSDS